MNEFTNPAGNLGNNPFLQAPSTILPMKGKALKQGLRLLSAVRNP